MAIVSFLIAKALIHDGETEEKEDMIKIIVDNVERGTDNDKIVLLNSAISWIQSNHVKFLWLRKYGYSLVKLFVQRYPTLIRQVIPDSSAEILLNIPLNEPWNFDNVALRSAISSLPICDSKYGVETTLAKHLFDLLQQKYDDVKSASLYDLVLKLQHFSPEQDNIIAKFLVDKLAEIKIRTPQETKQEVDKVVNLIEHWLKSEDNYADQRQTILMSELYQKIVKTDTKKDKCVNATVSALLTKISTTKLQEGLQNLSTHLIGHTAAVLAEWLVRWPYCISSVTPMLMHCLKRLAEERRSSELSSIAAQFASQLLKKLCIPVFQNTASIFFFLMIASHTSPEPLKQLLPELPSTVKQMVCSGQKNPVVALCLRKLGGLCLRLAEEHTEFNEKVQEIFKDVRIPSEVELSQMFISEEWFPSVARVADITLETSTPMPITTGPRGLCNLGNTCYMNSTLQALFFTPRFRQAVLVSNPNMQREPVLWQLQRLFCLMSFSPRSCISPNAELIAVAKPPGFTMGHQEDCSEFLVYLLNTLHEQEQGKSKQLNSGNKPETNVSTSTSRGQTLKRWTTEEDLSDADPATLLNGRRKARSLATFDETTPPSSVCPPPTPAPPPPLTDAYSDSKDSGIHSVGSTDEEEDDTLVQGVFGGRQSTTYKCLQCDFEYKTEDKFLDLQLALPGHDKTLSITDLITYFLQPEQLTGDNKYHCRQCNLLRDATKTIVIEKAPEHLILTIKRFRYEASTNQTAKVMVPIKCPEIVFVAGQEYKLYAVVLHAGSSPHSGHYHSQARSSSDSWLWLNDEVVSDIPAQDWGGADTPYVLFYKQTSLCVPTLELSLSSLLPRLQRLIEDDIRAYNRNNRSTYNNSEKHNQPPPPPPPSSSSGGGCGENLNTASNRYIC